MKVFVTGATGFVGHHVARALAAEGANLRLLTRKSSNLANLEGIPGDTVVGDLSDPDLAASSALAGMRRRRPRCRRLPSLDSRSRRHVPRQRRRHARAAAHGPRGRRQALRLHLERRHHALLHQRHRLQRRHAGLARRHGRPLQALQVSGRAGSIACSSPRAGGDDPKSHHPHRPQRPQAHAHRPHLRRLPQPANFPPTSTPA